MPDNTKRQATELVVRDHVDAFLGFGLTPLALAVAPVATQAKIPQIVTVAAPSMIVAQSPYIVRPAQVVTQTATTAPALTRKNGSAIALPQAVAPSCRRCGCRWPTQISRRFCNV